MIVPPLSESGMVLNATPEHPRAPGATPLLASTAQRQAQLAETARLTQQLQARLTRHRMAMIGAQADRAIENAEIKRATSSLASKFSLISKVLQNLG